jgi:hypothetical protein
MFVRLCQAISVPNTLRDKALKKVDGYPSCISTIFAMGKSPPGKRKCQFFDPISTVD